MKLITIDDLEKMPNGTVFFEYDLYDSIQALRVIDKESYEQENGFGFTERVVPDIEDYFDVDIFMARKPGVLKTEARCSHDETSNEIKEESSSNKLYAILDEREILQMIDVLKDSIQKNEESGKWHILSEIEPEDHEWVLIAHALYDTPIKAKFHVGEGFSFRDSTGRYQFVYLFDNEKMRYPLVKYWTNLPKMPEKFKIYGEQQ